MVDILEWLFSARGRQEWAQGARRSQPWREMRKADLHEVLTPLLAGYPTFEGFEPVADLLWVRMGPGAIHPVFALEKMKGGVICPAFGLSVDFVPKLKGQGAAFSPAPKGAKFDVFIGNGDHGLTIDFYHGAKAPLADARVTLPATFKQAGPFWSAHAEPASLADAIRRMDRCATSVRHTQALLARPFLLAAAGRPDEARAAWRDYKAVCDLSPPILAKLQAWLDEALAGAEASAT